MRLKTIKLAGFKSFVEPTTIPITGNLIGIVGPNGCGKSNIIDAIRWVMGEMSAKTLRGDSMADVIFNGSNTRKPVAQASVELVFDNSDGRAGGPYARFAEISIRREAGRDGQSDYYLNKTRCRRKDIVDLFLGTGLGPHSYSIIEQGMITRIIEARPEELRGFIEEAAGISRYKERRRETENRIRHTRENLARVEDIRQELATQLEKLKRQARAAERYKELKQEERLVRAQLLAMRHRDLSAQIAEHDARLAQLETDREAAMARVRAVEAEMERLRARHAEAMERFQAVQEEFYTTSNEITRLEEACAHARETRAKLEREQERLEQSLREIDAHRQADEARSAELAARLAELAPRLEAARGEYEATAAARANAEQALAHWQAEWEALGAAHAERVKQREQAAARLQSLEQQLAQYTARRARLAEEAAAIEARLAEIAPQSLRREAAECDGACDALEQALARIEDEIKTARAERERLAAEHAAARGEEQALAARLAGLEAQQAATPDVERLRQWLEAVGLADAPRLASRLEVESGWEKAVERVLGELLAGLCVASLPRVEARGAVPSLALFELGPPLPASRAAAAAEAAAETLLDKIRGEVDLAPWLGGIYTAETLDEALARRATLGARESIVTRQGEWVGPNWMVVGEASPERRGFLARAREIASLSQALGERREALARLAAAAAEALARLQALEAQREEQRRRLSEQHRRRAALRERLGHDEAQWKQLDARLTQLRQEQAELDAQHRRDAEALERFAVELAEAEGAFDTHAARHAELAAAREARQSALDAARAAEQQARDVLHRLEVEREGIETALEAVRAGLERLDAQRAQLSARRAELQNEIAALPSDEALQVRLDEALRRRLEIEERLNATRGIVAEIDARLHEEEEARAAAEAEAEARRAAAEAERVARERLVAQREAVTEQLREAGYSAAEAVAGEIPPEATEAQWAERLEDLAQRIARLGPINLAAIQEFEEAAERKGYLDRQSEDLTQALATLEEAIRKIDRETRTRFKETFDRLNERFQNFFPRLFGGGSAYLELTEDDLLEAGVTVMARPPGKRNSTIHLLSGGEKALTAVALLFALFELNPAPFCLLDEVDAPLDDVNVARYGETLKALAERTQLIFITHNKLTMEIAEVLIGVTMSEPGVSRLVAVDVDEAMRMVAQS